MTIMDGQMLTSKHDFVRLQLVNERLSEQTLMIEPWTTEYSLVPNHVYDIIAEGDTSLPVRVELTQEGITVCSLDSEGATVTVLEDGKQARPRDRH